ncbi:protease [Paenibacillus sp. 1001270B_150601_E10]|uniref:protease n=1 Tax=Paenibacillus sp. 1001270B_150601_E10 TaxID=2787079 RepID=UPI00189F4581|nr:protease [Paenibacillus sp. 1001270B_150601_E10]
METLYWGLIIFGVLYALVTLLFSEVLDHFFDALIGDSGLDFFQPTVLVSGLTVFGAAGLLLSRYTFLSTAWIIVLAVAGAIAVSIGVYFLYVRPMENSENSLSYSIQDLVGSIGDVSISIPSKGYGEVMIRIGLTNTNHIAASFEGEAIPQDSRVVVVEVKDHTVYVSPLDTGNSLV